MIRTIVPVIIAVAILIGAPISAFAVKHGSISVSTINLTVNCANGETIHKVIGPHGDINVNTGPVNVSCGNGGGGVGPMGPPGKNGQNATITIVTANGNQTLK